MFIILFSRKKMENIHSSLQTITNEILKANRKLDELNKRKKVLLEEKSSLENICSEKRNQLKIKQIELDNYLNK